MDRGRAVDGLVLGGIAIAERHAAKGDEHRRMLDKQDRGCRFFITQSVYDAGATKSLLSDYAFSSRRHSADTLERSVDLCEAVFTDVQAYAREKRLPIGINVESVSIQKAEIDASVELYRRLSSRLVA